MSARALVAIGGGYANAVMATPVISALRGLGYQVDALVEGHHRDAATLLSGWEALDTIYLTRACLRRAESGRKYAAVVRTVWNRGRPLRVGDEFRPERAPRRTHEIERNISALRPLGWSGNAPGTTVQYDEPLVPLPQRFIAVAPGCAAPDGKNAWPYWAEFCRRAHERFAADVLILGTADEEQPWMKYAALEVGGEISQPWLCNLCGRTSIRVAAVLVRRAEVVFALDGAIGHIAAALGRPTVALFGATDEAICGPCGANVRLVRAKVPCRPCQGRAHGARCADRRCMARISVEEVIRAGEELIGLDAREKEMRVAG